MQSVVITGAATGIGYSIAKTLISHEIKVFGNVLTQEDASRVANELGPLFVPLVFDITDEIAVKKAALQVQEQLQGEKLGWFKSSEHFHLFS